MNKIDTNPQNELLDCYMRGDYGLFSVLVDEGVNLNCLNESNFSLISIVIENPNNLKNNKKFFNKLISAGVSLEQVGWEEDLLTVCVKYQKDLYYAKKLIKNKININAIGASREYYNEYEEYDEYDEPYECRGVVNFSYGPPIFEALKHKKIDYFDLFLKNKADVSMVNSIGDSILIFFINNCIDKYSNRNFNKIFRTLLDYKIDHNIRDDDGADVLNLMSAYGLDDLIRVYFKKIKNIDVNSRDNEGNTNLIQSISSDNYLSLCTKLLVENNANLDTYSLWGTNALIRCVRFGNTHTLRYLINNGINLTSIDEFGNNIIHYIAGRDDYWDGTKYDKYYRIILTKQPELLLQENDSGITPIDMMKENDIYYGEKRKLINKFKKKARELEKAEIAKTKKMAKLAKKTRAAKM